MTNAARSARSAVLCWLYCVHQTFALVVASVGSQSPRAPEKINLKAIHLLLAHDEVCANE